MPTHSSSQAFKLDSIARQTKQCTCRLRETQQKGQMVLNKLFRRPPVNTLLSSPQSSEMSICLYADRVFTKVGRVTLHDTKKAKAPQTSYTTTGRQGLHFSLLTGLLSGWLSCSSADFLSWPGDICLAVCCWIRSPYFRRDGRITTINHCIKHW